MLNIICSVCNKSETYNTCICNYAIIIQKTWKGHNTRKKLLLLHDRMTTQISSTHTQECEMNKVSIELNTTFTHIITDYGFGNIPINTFNKILKDGRPFSHLIEKWIEINYPLQHIEGCKGYDFIDKNYPETLYDEKTFTSRGCSFCPSNMLGQGRSFNQKVFEEKTKKMVFCIVSNVNFPEIKIKFVRGCELIKLYHKGKIPSKDHVKFFN